MITADTILDYMKEVVKNKTPLDPTKWLDAAASLNVLLSDELNMLAEMEQEVAKMKLTFLADSDTSNVSAAKMKVEATDVYKKMRQQKSKCEIIEEFIRISKIQSRREGGF